MVTAILSLLVLALLVQSISMYISTKRLQKELGESKERFKIVYDLLWMEVRDKNDLSYENMAQIVVSMGKDMMPAVRETLAKRITGQDKKRIGFN